MKKNKKILKKIKKYSKKINHWHYLILALVAFGVIYTVKFFGYSGEERMVRIQVIGKNWNDSYSQDEGYRPPFWLIDAIDEGDIEKGPEGSINAEIIKVENFEIGDGSFNSYLLVKLRGVTNTKINKFTYRGRVIEVGTPIELSLNRAVISGQIIDDNVPKDGYEKQNFLIKVVKKQTESWAADSIKIGDVMTDGKNVIATVVDKKIGYSKNYFIYEVNSSYEAFDLIKDNDLKEVELTLEIEATNYNNFWYFAEDQLLKINNKISFYFENVNFLSARITSVLSLDEKTDQ